MEERVKIIDYSGRTCRTVIFIDVATAFLMTSDVIVIDMDLQGNETSRLVKRDDIDELDLPEKGTYIRCNKEKAMDYLWNKEYEFL